MFRYFNNYMKNSSTAERSQKIKKWKTVDI